jgi:peptidoglycan biosynthesis protein MviN/MurJ (putative lipid II flippase)
MVLIPIEVARRELGGGRHGSDEAVRNSLAVAFWVVVCRVSGVVRVAMTAAVLGATYLGNTFQAMNMLPNLAFEFLAGTLFGSLLVSPPSASPS